MSMVSPPLDAWRMQCSMSTYKYGIQSAADTAVSRQAAAGDYIAAVRRETPVSAGWEFDSVISHEPQGFAIYASAVPCRGECSRNSMINMSDGEFSIRRTAQAAWRLVNFRMGLGYQVCPGRQQTPRRRRTPPKRDFSFTRPYFLYSAANYSAQKTKARPSYQVILSMDLALQESV